MKKLESWSCGAAQAVLGAMLALALAACGGGGGDAGTPIVPGPGTGASTPTGGTPGTPTPTAADLVVVLSKSTLSNSGTDSITASVTSINASRAAVGSVPVSFAVDANAVVTPGGATTDATTGTQTATIRQGSDATPRPVTLTVTSGSVTRAVTFNIVKDATPTERVATDLTLTLSTNSINNSGTPTVTARATAVGPDRNALEGIPVQLSVTDPSAFVIAPTSQTNANGQVTGTIDIGRDRSNRTITVTATSGTLTRTAAFEVTGTQFAQATAVPSVVAPGAAGTVQYRVADVNGNAMPDVLVTVSGNGVTTGSGRTNLNGGYDFSYTAPNAPGTTLTLTARAGGVTSVVGVPISGGTGTVPNAATPAARTLNLSADVVSVNVENTNNQVSINAFFRDAANAPVPNVRVLFGVTGDNGTGTISSGSNTVLSDASGTASANYRPGAVSSPTNGVTIRACWKTTDFTAGETVANCPASNVLTTTLTIVSSPVSISIGTDNTIIPTANLTYIKKYVVLVVDSAGNPKADVQITPSVDLGGYGKGSYFYDDVDQAWTPTLLATCPNEDRNRNGVIDGGEDDNGNQQLDPRKSDVAVALSGSTRTDANGVAILQLEYPQNVASWVKFKITVTAAGVLSPPAYYPLGVPVSLPSLSVDGLAAAGQSAGNYLGTYAWLPVLASALTTKSPPPAFRYSPYGSTSSSCKSPQ